MSIADPAVWSKTLKILNLYRGGGERFVSVGRDCDAATGRQHKRSPTTSFNLVQIEFFKLRRLFIVFILRVSEK